MNTATIIWKKAGHLIDDRYLLAVLKANPTCIGTVVRVDGELHVSQDRGVPDLETMKKGVEAAKDYETIFWLANIQDQKLLRQEDIQPFVFEQDGKTLLAIFAEGDFPKFSKPGTNEDEWGNLASDIIIPTLNDYAEMAEGDFNKFLDKMHGSLFEKQIMAHVGHRGVITIVPCVGETLSLAQSEMGAEYDWGAVSNTHGFDPNQVDQEPVVAKVEKKKFSLFAKKDEPKAEEVKEPAPVVVPPKDTPAKDLPKTDTAIPNGKGQLVAVPVNLKGKARKQHIRKLMRLSSGDALPDGWFRDDFKAFVPEAKLKDLKDIGKVIEAKKEGEYPSSSVSAASSKVEDKTNKAVIPVISEKNKLAVMDFVVKRLDANSNQTGDPTKLQELEKAIPSFSEATGVQLEDIFRLSYNDLEALQKTYPMEFTLLTMEFRRKYMDTLKMEDLVGTKAPVEPKKEEVVVEQPKKVAAGGKKNVMSFFNR